MDELGSNLKQLDEDTSKHVVQVLRMKIGEKLLLTDGKGSRAEAEITDDNKKRCIVKLLSVKTEPPKENRIAIAISLVKNASRFEWFLEKAGEMGLTEIIPLICERTEKERFRYERMQQILVSAMLQSQQTHLPQLQQPIEFEKLVNAGSGDYPDKYIAHCLEEEKTSLYSQLENKSSGRIILIGPEGDFSPGEIKMAIEKGYRPVSLGVTRLRTETAGLVAAALLSNSQSGS
jgi:16S rRNA (uracil1498-N3)-methyltransferase